MRHLLAVASRRQSTGDKVVEYIDVGAEDDIHEREGGTRGNHAEKGNGVDDPSLGVVVFEDALLSGLAKPPAAVHDRCDGWHTR